MKIIKTSGYEEMSVIAARILGSQILLRPDCVLGLATGSTPIGTYEKLREDYKNGILDFSQVRTVNLDEYCGLSPDDPQSYRYFMRKNLFDEVNIDLKNTHLPDGTAKDMDAEVQRYEELVDSLGGVDIQLLGIGNNGHIGFNEPTDHFPKCTHRVQLTQSTINANSRLFDSIDDVPVTAVTMGIGTIMKAKKILLIAGAEKADIIEKALYGEVTPQVPASILQFHKDVTVVISR